MNRTPRTLAVVGVSSGTLAYEVLLVRVFAIEHFHHFAYMAIGVAMLGFGVSGTALALARPRDERTRARWFSGACIATTLALILSPTLVHQVALDPTQLAWDFGQWVRLALVYVLLAVPFVAGALAILLALTLDPDRPGWIYGASFAGSGLGAVLAIAVLWPLAPVRALAVPAIVAGLGAVCGASGLKRRTRAFALAGLAIGTVALARPFWRLTLTPYKALPQVEAFPNAERVAERSSPIGWVTAVRAPAFRYAPGLSLGFRGQLPRQTGLFTDGQLVGAATEWGDEPSALGVLDWLPSAFPYVIGRRDHVLVVGGGTGIEVANALAHGARRVTAMELDPYLVELAQEFGTLPAGPTGAGSVTWVLGDARHQLARSRDSFDLVTLGPVGGGAIGTSAAGVHALGEDFLHTQEAYSEYLDRLTEGGVLSITGWLTVPPRANVRILLTAVDALRRVAPDHVSDGLLVARSWGTVTVLVKPSGFGSPEVEALRDWATARSFDLDWYPGIAGPEERFNLLDRPVFFEAARAAVVGSDDAARFADSYAFNVAPATDLRPYPHHFLRISSLGTLVRSDRGSWLPFAEWGTLALMATLIQSVVLAGVLLVVPVVFRRGMSQEPGLVRVIGYFAAIGLAYLAAEIAAIQQLGLLLGHPVYAVAAVLAAFLLFSGAGSVWSDRLGPPGVPRAGVALVLAIVVYATALPSIVHVLQPTPLIMRGLMALVLLGPLAFLMGIPFPIGIRTVARGDSRRLAWAWAANGFASVTGAPLAALVALELGASAVLVVAASAYVVAGGLLWRRGKP